jgi:hypothetical protein
VFVVVIKPCATQISQKRQTGSTLFLIFFERFSPEQILGTKTPRGQKKLKIWLYPDHQRTKLDSVRKGAIFIPL